MIEMPATEGTPTLEEAIRALELAHTYYALGQEVRDPGFLAQFTSRRALEDALDTSLPWAQDQDRNVARYCRHAEQWLRIRRGASKSAKAGAARLRGTLKRFVYAHGEWDR